MKNILFVCKHNMFRSMVAEDYFKKINKDAFVSSAGVIRGYLPLNKLVVEAGKELGINMNGKPQGLSIDFLRKQDLIIIVADDVPKNLFNNKKYLKSSLKVIRWDITDIGMSYNKQDIKRIMEQIIKKVNELNEQLGKKK